MRDKRKVYSYDVFDTCLVRACGPSYVAFEVLAREILGKNADISQIRDFALLRIQGEKKAKEIAEAEGLEDTSIDRIYKSCDFTCLTQVRNDEILKKELEVETNLLLPVVEMTNAIEEARKEGNAIVFITDMYLPSYFIKGILSKYGILKGDEPVYVSGEIGKTKRTGSLFEYVKEQFGIDTSEWRHFGDNKQSDYRIPRKLGIKAKRIKHEYSYYEKETLKLEFSNSRMEALKTASISRALIKSRYQSPYTLFSSDFVAPLYVPFVYDTMKDAQRRGVQSLYFLARDGFILYQIAQQFKDDFPDIKLFYIYVSRVSLYLPGLKDVSYNSLLEAFDIKNRELQTVLEYLRLEDLKEELSDYQTLQGEELLKALINDVRFNEILGKKHREQRELCIEYFKQEGIVEGNCAIVDLVGTRRCQLAINNILKSEGFPEVFGYYFDVVPYRIFEGNYKSYNFSELRTFLNANTYLGSQGVFEQYFSITDQGRTLEYKKDDSGLIIPIHEKIDKKEYYAKQVLESNLDICRAYAHFFSYMQPMNCQSCEETAIKIYSLFSYNPRKEYLKALVDLHITSVTLSEDFLPKTNMLKLFTRKKSFWMYGSIIYNSGMLYSLFRWLLSFYQQYKLRKQVNSL